MNPKTELKNLAAIQPTVLLSGLAALVLAITVPARAETRPAAIPFSDIGARATADYQGGALGVTATVDGARLRCGFQKIEGHATAEGLWLESTGPDAAGKLRLVATALGREGNFNSQPATTLPASGTVSVQDKMVRFTRPGLTEEYSVSVDGVRQDFVIAARPAGAGDLRVELALSGARAEASVGGARLRLEGSGRALAYSRLRVEDATGRAQTARLDVLSGDRLAVSVADANAIYPVRIDPTFSDADWVSLNPGMVGADNCVNAIAVDGNGNVYVGGAFTVVGKVAANHIAKWDGGVWSALGSGMNGGVAALAVSGTNLYAGGGYSTAGGVPVNNIAKWDGSTWSGLGSGMSDGVLALAVIGTNLYAGGQFTSAGGVPAPNVAKWDGSAWSALGSGMSGSSEFGVLALAVSGTNLYAGGDFITAGGVTANAIARWDGNTWSALGSGMGGGNPYGPPSGPVVYALAASGADVYAGGEFTSTGGVTANYIAKWDGSTWSALGSGVNSDVWALAADGAGHLFVGGIFSMAGTNVSPYIAQANLGHVPTILVPPPTQTAEMGATVHSAVDAHGGYLTYELFFNGTNLISSGSYCSLNLTNVNFSQSGTYTVVVTNVFGAATSAPAMLNVIAPEARRWVPGVNLMAQAGNFLGLDYRDDLGPAANWETMATMTLSNSSQFYFDVSEPLPPQRSYRAWQSGTPGVVPSLDLHFVPAITLTGNVGDSLRLDYINQFGPIDAWVTLATVALTNTSQLYFEVSVIGQPARLWRIVPVQ